MVHRSRSERACFLQPCLLARAPHAASSELRVPMSHHAVDVDTVAHRQRDFQRMKAAARLVSKTHSVLHPPHRVNADCAGSRLIPQWTGGASAQNLTRADGNPHAVRSSESIPLAALAAPQQAVLSEFPSEDRRCSHEPNPKKSSAGRRSVSSGVVD